MSKTISHSPGLRITLPDGVELTEAKSQSQKRRAPRPSRGLVPLPGVHTSITDEASRIAGAMTNDDMVLVGKIALAAAPGGQQRTRATTSARAREMTVEVDLRPEEGAVILLERDGLYSWHLDSAEIGARATSPGVKRRGVATGSGTRTVRFHVPVGPAVQSGTRKRGWLTDLVLGPAQAFVFKFAGRFLLGQAAAFLERKVQAGVVIMDGDDPSKWKRVPDFLSLNLPKDRPARILLFVHGTFSSTSGGFGALGATPWGRSFMAAARANYDAVIGFDHPTLSVDPLANATAILRSFEAREWTQPAIIDAISHSRGGITLRSLIEYLLPATNLPIRLERAVFVGAVNGGTELAEPKNWRSFIDLYTNIAAGACRAVAMFPQATFAAILTEELFKSVGTFAKVLAEEATRPEIIPGLAAMHPKGKFITALNETQPGQPTAANSRYYTVTSEFRASLAIDSMKELPRQLLMALADGAVDQVMGVTNDLVVNTDSMALIDPHSGNFIKDTLAFGKNGIVYHTNYFLQPQVTNALARWLELELPAVASPARLRGSFRGGAAIPTKVPAHIDTDVLAVLAEDDGRTTRERIQKRTPSYVVVARTWQGQPLHYAFQTEEVLAAIAKNPAQALMDALDLHESDASVAGPVAHLPQPRPDAIGVSARRVVAMDGGKVVGVGEATVVATTLPELVRQAKEVAAPKNQKTEILARRMMPTFNRYRPIDRIDTTRKEWPFVHGVRRLPANAKTGETIAGLPSGRRLIRGAKRGAPRPMTSPSVAPSAEKDTGVACYFVAEMDDEVVVGTPTAVDVTLSREIVQAVRSAVAEGQALVQKDRKLTVEVIPKKNFVVVGNPRVDVDVPQPGKPDPYIFDVKGTDVGEGEILVRIRQEGTQPLASLTLRSKIVKKRTRPAVRLPERGHVEEMPSGPQPLHQLTILEIERGGKLLYHYTFDSPTLGIRDIYESNPLVGSREDYVNGIYKDIEERYLSVREDYDEFQVELRQVGGGLWDELFPEKLQAALWKARKNIESILVFSEEPFIPWELVHLKEPGKGLPKETLFFGQMGLVRWLHNVGWPTTELRARPKRCRYVIPHYPHPEYALPEAETEAEFLEDRFGATPVEPHSKPLRELLEKSGSFDLLHFACHGTADSNDIRSAELLLEGSLEGSDYKIEILRVSVIENLSGLTGDDGVRPIITLNACQASRAGYKMTRIGGFSRAFLKQGAGLFIAALWSVGDAPAKKFTETLYARLLAKDTLAQAAKAARETARKDKEATWLAYTVYGNPHARLVQS